MICLGVKKFLIWAITQSQIWKFVFEQVLITISVQKDKPEGCFSSFPSNHRENLNQIFETWIFPPPQPSKHPTKFNAINSQLCNLTACANSGASSNLELKPGLEVWLILSLDMLESCRFDEWTPRCTVLLMFDIIKLSVEFWWWMFFDLFILDACCSNGASIFFAL